jgi:hypothetical protein
MGNIIGSNLDTWAINQIKLRQRLLGANPRDSKVLSWVNNRTAWIRASSPVSISPDKSKELTGEKFRYAGRQLAKEFVLFNGTVGLLETVTGNPSLGFTPIQKAGVTDDNTIINDFAYGFGGNTPQGIVPMPGIESLNITTYSRGALRKAELKIKVHNKYQFGIIDALYMKPGYTILLEWGNSIYYTGTPDNPEYKTANFNTKAFLNFFSKKGTNQETLLSDIRDDRRISEGNYDGFYGKITNFSWTYNTDGSYDISISAISIGDVIESLNINRVLIEDKPQPVTKTSRTSTNNSKLITLTGKTANGQTFSREFSEAEAKKYVEYWTQIENLATGPGSGGAVSQKVKAAGGPKTLTPPPNRVEAEEKVITALLDDKDRSDFNKFLYESVYNYIVGNINKNGQEVLPSSNPNVKNKIKTFASSLDGELNYKSDGKDIVGIGTKVTLTTTNFQGETVGNTTRSSRNFPFLYIKLGSLLKYIQSKLLIITDDSSTSPNEPLIKFDLSNDNYCFTFPLQYSLNPNICVIPFGVAESNDTEIKEDIIEARYWENILGTSFRNENSKYVGNLYDIHVNIHYIAGLLKSCTTNNSLPLLRFLETLMNGIQSALGSVNKFTVSYEHDTNRIKIYDDIPLDKNFLASLTPPIKDTPESVATFNILGYSRNIFEGSFIQNVSLTTTISNQLASMISIGAQAQTPSDVTNATGFMKFNKGLTDSIIPTKVSVVAAQQQVKDNPEKSMAKFYTKLKAKGGIINDLYLQGITPTSEMIDSQQTNAAIIFRSLTSKYSIKEDVPTQSFIPFNLGLQMDGFSGAKIYEKFTINSEILPPGYPNVLNFVIKGLTHNISSEGWVTNIESLTLAR